VLPTAKPPSLREDSAFSGCLTLEELNAKIESENIGIGGVPHFTVLRCALASGKLEKQPTTEELFKCIEDRFPELSPSENVELQVGPSSLLSPSMLFLSHFSCRCRIDYGRP